MAKKYLIMNSIISAIELSQIASLVYVLIVTVLEKQAILKT